MISEKTKRDRDKILKFLVEARNNELGFVWLREISRKTEIPFGTVLWIVNRYLYPRYIEYPDADALITRGLRIKPIKLRDDVVLPNQNTLSSA